MEPDLSLEPAGFRTEIRAWIGANIPKGLPGLADWATPVLTASNRREGMRALRHPLFAEWERRLLSARLICPQWPPEVGGRGWDPVRATIFATECRRAGVPRVTRTMGEELVGPAVIVHGSDAQRTRFLPRIISGEDNYCQGFSEPGHGSDLAGVQTRGVIEGDEIIVTGQKVWTSDASEANMIFVLCRTDPHAPKHAGLSFVLIPLLGNNIEVRAIRQMTGAAEFYEEFLDGARAPLANVIGGVGNGWRVAMTTLGYERSGTATVAYLGYEREFWDLVEAARRYGRNRDPHIRQQLAWAYSQVQIMRYQGMRTLARLAIHGEPGPEAAGAKLFWSEYHRRLGEIAIEILGAHALVRPEGDGYRTGRWQDVFLVGRGETIYSGTSEIQRNIIGERVLGLPKEPQAAEQWRGAEGTARGARG